MSRSISYNFGQKIIINHLSLAQSKVQWTRQTMSRTKELRNKSWVFRNPDAILLLIDVVEMIFRWKFYSWIFWVCCWLMALFLLVKYQKIGTTKLSNTEIAGYSKEPLLLENPLQIHSFVWEPCDIIFRLDCFRMNDYKHLSACHIWIKYQLNA